jgi:hypothetical protein
MMTRQGTDQVSVETPSWEQIVGFALQGSGTALGHGISRRCWPARKAFPLQSISAAIAVSL